MQRRNTQWGLPLLLMALTFASTLYVGAGMVLGHPATSLMELATGWVFCVPLMAILMAHEFGHFFAGKYHHVDVSPPYFIPVPFFLLGTLGAVIQIRERIRSRNALLDIGAAGPLAGMAVALPVIIYGIATSPVEALPDTPYMLEGRSLLYLGLLSWLKGPIPPGYDIMLTPTALAGWAGLLVTMINLLPFGQLDGGHVAYALLGRRQDQLSRKLLRLLPLLAVVVSAAYGIPTYLEGARGDRLVYDASAGMHWLVWSLVLWLLTRATGPSHPPTEATDLSPRRRLVGRVTLS
ncbi:MAG: site-2 protease family protein, partial [Deltaproteobacteria bacterium]